MICHHCYGTGRRWFDGRVTGLIYADGRLSHEQYMTSEGLLLSEAELQCIPSARVSTTEYECDECGGSGVAYCCDKAGENS
jgi:hypothetical protein